MISPRTEGDLSPIVCEFREPGQGETGPADYGGGQSNPSLALTAYLRRVFAIGPRACQFHVFRWFEETARVACVPADNLARLTVLLAALLPALGPTAVRELGAAALLVPE